MKANWAAENFSPVWHTAKKTLLRHEKLTLWNLFFSPQDKRHTTATGDIEIFFSHFIPSVVDSTKEPGINDWWKKDSWKVFQKAHFLGSLWLLAAIIFFNVRNNLLKSRRLNGKYFFLPAARSLLCSHIIWAFDMERAGISPQTIFPHFHSFASVEFLHFSLNFSLLLFLWRARI